ncbi:type IV conjugative transfer system protein TraL [Entomohabitans teleogrylli]|uniref:type IV conjugative transfer system protein TraL n=1 Tax=Entomohabitans teleogrylli TaxID=1384589 RepID=UPI00073D76AC|nr:type IV conjugative transfer system protein TraL [Entomohabitans teleogrylli]
MNEERNKRFRFPQTLSEQIRPVGLPLDETVALFGPMTWGLYEGQYVAPLVVSVLLWVALKHFKKGKGSSWLFNACYWYLPGSLFNGMYKVIPDSSFRLWLR